MTKPRTYSDSNVIDIAPGCTGALRRELWWALIEGRRTIPWTRSVKPSELAARALAGVDKANDEAEEA